MAEKFFTLEEANAVLPQIKKELEALQKVKLEIDEKYRDLQLKKSSSQQTAASETNDPHFTLEAELDFLMFLAEGHIDQIHQSGAQLKDIDRGLLDFPSLLDGQVVLLCWKQGEEVIEHWHSTWEGFAGRKKIEPDDPL